jgi:hypothetical protein
MLGFLPRLHVHIFLFDKELAYDLASFGNVVFGWSLSCLCSGLKPQAFFGFVAQLGSFGNLAQ